LGQAILSISKEVGIPFSDPNIYHKFISSILVGLNSDTIRRKYTGLPGILTPSDRIVRILENTEGKKFLVTDIYKQSIQQDNIDSFKQENPNIEATNENLFNHYLNKYFPASVKVSTDTINLGDWVNIDGNEINIDSPITLKRIQNQYQSVNKIYNKARDLRPAIHSWSVLTEDNNYVRKNIWSSDIIILSYLLKNEKFQNKPGFEIYQPIIDEFKIKFGEIIDGEIKINNQAKKLIERRIQHYTMLLDSGFDFKNLDSVAKFLLNGTIDAQDKVAINNYEVKEAECIMPSVYSKKFNVEGRTLREVMDNAEEIFTNQVKNIYKEALKNTDLTINTGSLQYGIRFVDKK
jgi:hypothetical protein